MLLLREKTLNLSAVAILNNYAKLGNGSCCMFNEDEEIQVQRGNFWPKFTHKVGDRVTVRAEFCIFPVTFHAMF